MQLHQNGLRCIVQEWLFQGSRLGIGVPWDATMGWSYSDLHQQNCWHRSMWTQAWEGGYDWVSASVTELIPIAAPFYPLPSLSYLPHQLSYYHASRHCASLLMQKCPA